MPFGRFVHGFNGFTRNSFKQDSRWRDNVQPTVKPNELEIISERASSRGWHGHLLRITTAIESEAGTLSILNPTRLLNRKA